jgi:cephalosporin hydroxylase
MTAQDVNSFGETALDEKTAQGIQAGVLSYTYRGIPFLKCPFDIANYLQLIWELRPGTILEFGSKAGGSALWLADALTTFGMNDTTLRSYDIHPVTTLRDERISFRKIDVARSHEFLSAEDLASLPRPLLAIDDASHRYGHVLTLLEFLHPHLRHGDYVIVEDGIVERLGLADRYEGGPTRAIGEFLARHPGVYEIDRRRCDAFGRNVTWNVEGYIRRIA